MYSQWVSKAAYLFFDNGFGHSDGFLFGRVYPSTHLEKKYIATRIYLSSRLVSGNEPAMSIVVLSNGLNRSPY